MAQMFMKIIHKHLAKPHDFIVVTATAEKKRFVEAAVLAATRGLDFQAAH